VQTLAQRLALEGALSAPDALAVLLGACEALARLSRDGTVSGVSPETVELTGDAVAVRAVKLESGEPGVEQSRQLAALAYAALRGEPPEPGAPAALIGVRRDLAQLIETGLAGQLSSLEDFWQRARALPSGNTVGLERTAAPARTSRPSEVPVASRVGETIGSWTLEALLGAGGMGEVYRARHTRLARVAAVKLLNAQYADDAEVVGRLFDEARLVNTIRNPHLVDVFDFVESPPACVMELLHGKTLAEVPTPVPVSQLFEIAQQVGEALAAAHAQGVVHRDIKPENLFLVEGAARDTFVKVLDFGIARQLGTLERRTQAGAVLGTPAFMAPEQAAGRTVDARSDLYSLGVVLHGLLTGRPLPTAPEVLTQSSNLEPVPPGLGQLIQDCLALEPGQRPQSAEEFLRRLAAANARRPKGPLVRVAVVALSALVLLGAALLGTHTFERELPPPELLQPPTPKVQEPAAQPDTAEEHSEAARPRVEAPAEVPRAPVRTVTKPSVKPPARGEPPGPAPTAPEMKMPAVPSVEDRQATLRARYDRLLSRHGADQLTTLEKTIVGRAVAPGVAPAVLESGEQAVRGAEVRLDR
jgi:serine/threonine protein kinase